MEVRELELTVLVNERKTVVACKVLGEHVQGLVLSESVKIYRFTGVCGGQRFATIVWVSGVGAIELTTGPSTSPIQDYYFKLHRGGLPHQWQPMRPPTLQGV